MPKYSDRSQINLIECHPDLQRLFREVIKHWDNQIIDGRRSIEQQKINVSKGVSKTMNSKHLAQEDGKSWAVDSMPFPYDWDKIQRGLDALKRADPTMQIAEVYAYIGFVKGIAAMMGIDIRQGADWNGNNQFDDHTFIDLPHTEKV